jgi:CBS domain-containing protein
VQDLMNENVRTATLSDPLRDVYSRMRLDGIRHMPVVDDHGRLVGVLSDRDVLLAWSRGPDTPVASFMSRQAHFTTRDALATDAAARLLHDRIGCLPVVDARGVVVGIVTETDFLRIAYLLLVDEGQP